MIFFAADVLAFSAKNEINMPAGGGSLLLLAVLVFVIYFWLGAGK